ncbi:MAG: substrate-binding domain-containing protein [Candidatus Eisenbacteria bacterium]|nr:substrate-binding domain-containing protein [Candidatus Eisenbacteria bacterium]
MTRSRPARRPPFSLRRRLTAAVLCCLLAAVASCDQFADKETATSGTIYVCASESHFELIQEEADQFVSLYKKASVTVLGASTREAIVHLLKDSVSVAVVDRVLNPEEERVLEEADFKLDRVEVALDAVAIVVNRLNETKGITREMLKDILVGNLADWGHVPGSGLTGPVELVMTGRNSGTYELVKDRFFNLSEDIQAAVVLPSQKEVVEHVAKRPQAVGIVSLAALKSPALQPLTADSTNAVVRALHFAGRDSTGKATFFKLHQAHIHLGKYPLTYPVYVYFRKDSDLAPGFVGFLTGAAGQKIILNWGLVPATMPVRIVTLT